MSKNIPASKREANPCSKTRKIKEPYEIWVNDMLPDWEWRVLKKWQAPSKEATNPYARWFVAVKSPMTYGSWEMGDEYVTNVQTGYRLSDDEAAAAIEADSGPDWQK